MQSSKEPDMDDNFEFKKFDTSKPALELVEPGYIIGTGEILTMGMEKYGRNNWKNAKPEDIERIKGAMLRHLMSYLSGDKIDDESGLNHMYHISCNAMFLSYFDEKEQNDKMD